MLVRFRVTGSRDAMPGFLDHLAASLAFPFSESVRRTDGGGEPDVVEGECNAPRATSVEFVFSTWGGRRGSVLKILK